MKEIDKELKRILEFVWQASPWNKERIIEKSIDAIKQLFNPKNK